MIRRSFVSLTTLLSVLFVLSGAAQFAGAQESSKVAPPEKSGIAVGQKAPTITLKDQTGKERSLDEWLHDGTVALVFFRSARW